jgi:hypothetical protein
MRSADRPLRPAAVLLVRSERPTIGMAATTRAHVPRRISVWTT